jgi:hypothetical protein
VLGAWRTEPLGIRIALTVAEREQIRGAQGRDWIGLLLDLLFVCLLILKDGIAIVVLIGVAHLVQWILDRIEGIQMWRLGPWMFHASDVVHDLDLVLLIAFVVTLGCKFVIRMAKHDS